MNVNQILYHNELTGLVELCDDTNLVGMETVNAFDREYNTVDLLKKLRLDGSFQFCNDETQEILTFALAFVNERCVELRVMYENELIEKSKLCSISYYDTRLLAFHDIEHSGAIEYDGFNPGIVSNISTECANIMGGVGLKFGIWLLLNKEEEWVIA